MNRNSGGPPRRPKTSARSHLPTGDFIALGPKGPRAPETELKPLQPLKPPQPSTTKKPTVPGLVESKREPSSPLQPAASSKRPKLLASPPFSPLSSKAGEPESSKRSGTSTQSSPIHLTPIEVNPSDLEQNVLDAEASGDRLRVDGLLLGAIKGLKANRNKPDAVSYLGLMCLAKSKPDLFSSSRVLEALTSILKRDISINLKVNKNTASLVSIMAANILLYVYQEDDEWPESFVKVYVEDSLGDRVWVDSESCQLFVDNILTAFGTKMAPRAVTRQGSDPGSKATATEQGVTPPTSQLPASTAIMMPKEEEGLLEEVEMMTCLEDDVIPIIPRFLTSSVEHNISTYIMELVQDQLTRRQAVDNISRNLLRFLTATCGYGQVRLLVSQRIEVWLQNPKLTRPAQELLMSLALNCNTHSHEDIEVISNLIRMRLKTKPLANHYVSCIRELIGQHHENLGTVLKHVIYNELSNTRNPNNMSLLGMMYQYKPEAVAKLLAMVFQDLLANRDDYLRACRALLREVMRALRHELNCVALCRGFMSERTESQFTDLDSVLKVISHIEEMSLFGDSISGFRKGHLTVTTLLGIRDDIIRAMKRGEERMLVSIADLIVMTTMLSVTPAVKDVATAWARGEKKDLSVLQQFQKNVSTIQRDAVWWLHTVVPKMFNVSAKEYLACLQKVIFLDPVESYSGKDNWPPEADRSLLYNLASEVPVQEDTLMRVVIIGLSTELPVNAPEALDIADKLTRRAAAIKSGVTTVSVSRLELLDAVLNLCAYHHPKDIQLPSGYLPPKLAIANLYWKAWSLLAIVASLNPSSIGHAGWENFPMLKCMMEMILTNNFVFPPPTLASSNDERDEILSQDLQLVQLEKEDILEFETHLAAATTGVNITESNSLLISQLISMDPVGPARRPPQTVLDQLKATNKSLRLGQLLCRSRSPDFLLDIIQRQGASQSMPWLADLVQSSEGSLDVLPVQCLCEFLLMEKSASRKSSKDGGAESSKDSKDKKMNIQAHVLTRLRSLLFGSSASAESTAEVLEYFMRRLSSSVTSERKAASKGLKKVLSENTTNEGRSSVTSMDDDVTMATMPYDPDNPDDSGSKLKSSLPWLLVNLPSLPYFENVRSICCFALRQCCQVEITPLRLQAYLVFLAQHTGSPSDADFAEAILEISQLVIERPTVLSQVLSESECGEETHQAILSMYNTAVSHAIHAQDNAYFENDNQDQLFVQWSKDTVHAGNAATLHALVIQAAIVLLTWPAPKGDQSVYLELMDTWCPCSGHVKVYLTDTGEEAVLLPEWLRLRMIRADVPRVVDAAVADLVPAQLVLFAQSFGIPVYSMSKLLQQLDMTAQEDAVGMAEAVLDKGYMLQLVEVQQLRGATGGDVFCSLLTDEPLLKPQGTSLTDEGRLSPLTVIPSVAPVTAKEEPARFDVLGSLDTLETVILKILQSSTDKEGSHKVACQIKQRLTKEVIMANKGERPEMSVSDNLIGTLNKVDINVFIEMLRRNSDVIEMFPKEPLFDSEFEQTIHIQASPAAKPRGMPERVKTKPAHGHKRGEERSMMVDLIAGGLGGSTGVILTCPLDVIQTRLQSSAFRLQRISHGLGLNMASIEASSISKPTNFYGVFSYGRFIARTEGTRSLFKGLSPTLLAVTPSRAIYFTTYKKVKDWLNKSGVCSPDSSAIYLTSGAAAQFVNSTVTNPLWFLKTRMQLNFEKGQEVKALRVVQDAYRSEGIRAFYRGLTASYMGMLEVGLHFTFYEKFKQQLVALHGKTSDHEFSVVECTLAAGGAKVISTGMCYPYEVIRTRLRQQESDVLGKQRYRTCLQTLRTVAMEEGWFGMYGGLGTNLMRQVPFTTVMFCVYEGVVYLLGGH